MVAKKLINLEIPRLKSTDTVDKALQIMSDLKIAQLPYIEESIFDGFFSEDLLLNFDNDLNLGQIPRLEEKKVVYAQTPLLEIIRIFANAKETMLPVLDENGIFLGVVDKNSVFITFVEELNLYQPGGLVEIILESKDYSLLQIARIIENENAKILCLFISKVEGQPYSDKLVITIKIDLTQISGIVNALGRYGFEVSSYFATEPVANLEKDRYDMLMKYLSI
jgi:acetoin utilization protein AcuB